MDTLHPATINPYDASDQDTSCHPLAIMPARNVAHLSSKLQESGRLFVWFRWTQAHQFMCR